MTLRSLYAQGRVPCVQFCIAVPEKEKVMGLQIQDHYAQLEALKAKLPEKREEAANGSSDEDHQADGAGTTALMDVPLQIEETVMTTNLFGNGAFDLNALDDVLRMAQTLDESESLLNAEGQRLAETVQTRGEAKAKLRNVDGVHARCVAIAAKAQHLVKDAVQAKWPQERVEALQAEASMAATRLKAVVETMMAAEQQFPCIRQEMAAEDALIAKAVAQFQRFAFVQENGTVRYVAEGTPSQANEIAAEAFLQKQVQAAKSGGLISPAAAGQTPLLIVNGQGWVPVQVEVSQAVDLINAMGRYQIEIGHARARAIKLADMKLVSEGWVIPVDAAKAQKQAKAKDGRALHHPNVLDLIERGVSGDYNFMKVPNGNVYEVKIVKPAIKQDGRSCVDIVAATTAAGAREILFRDGKMQTRRIYFGNPYKLASVPEIKDTPLAQGFWETIGRVDRDRREKQDEVEILKSDSNRITMNEAADGKAGVVTFMVRDYRNPTIAKCMSDGMTVKVVKATRRSLSGSRLCMELGENGKPVAEIFARDKAGNFTVSWVADLALKNETYEVDWRMDVLASEHKAIRVSADNVAAALETVANGGKDGMYGVSRPCSDEDHPEVKRHVGYVISRSGDELTFVASATPYSAQRLRQAKLSLNKAYGLMELHGFPVYILSGVYTEMAGVSRDKLPAHLLQPNKRPKEEVRVPLEPEEPPMFAPEPAGSESLGDETNS